jgi:hypothetical protein
MRSPGEASISHRAPQDHSRCGRKCHGVSQTKKKIRIVDACRTNWSKAVHSSNKQLQHCSKKMAVDQSERGVPWPPRRNAAAILARMYATQTHCDSLGTIASIACPISFSLQWRKCGCDV